jgi:formate-dependent nitrite reductase membrane component NrfD
MIAETSHWRDWDIALMIFLLAIAMFATEIRKYLWHKRFFSPERKRIENVSTWWQERAR